MQSSLRFLAITLVGGVAFLAALAHAQADGIIVPREPCPVPQPLPGDHTGVPPYSCIAPFLPITYHHVDVTIRDQVAEVHVDQAFENTGETPLEATYVFPLPPDAAVSDFTMEVDGKQLEGKLLDRNEARAMYEEIVRRQLDPALLEYVDQGVFQASVFPIPPHEERRVQISYTQVLKRESGLVRFVYPLSTEKFSPVPIPDVSVTVDIESSTPIGAVYSPTHDIAVARAGANKASASLELADVTPRSDFELLYSTSEDDIGLNLTTYRTGDDDGYFLALVSPKVEVDAERVVDKDVVLVLDTSGSMRGEKIEQAKDAARFIVEHLNNDDRFNVIAFDSTVRVAFDRLRGVDEGRRDALDFVDGLGAHGSTNINDALSTALDQVSSNERPSLVIFLTDGLPTAGVTDAAEIVRSVGATAPKTVRLFTFGVGYDVNAILLDQLAEQNRGLSEYVAPDEDVANIVSGFYERVSDPVLSDIDIDFGNVEVSDIYPNPLPDLFAGSQLIVVGRYNGHGTVDVTLTGSIDGRTQRYTYENISFPESALRDSYLPRLWATRKIGFLLNSVRLDAPSDEVIDEIVELSKRYGVITPYTSFLVEEPGLTMGQAASRFEAQGVPALAPSAGADVSGTVAFDTAQKVGGYRAANSLADTDDPTITQLRAAGEKAFVLNDDVWTDTIYEDSPTTKIGFAGDNYFEILHNRPDWSAYFALGDHVIFVNGGTAYEIAPGDYPAVDVPASDRSAPDTPPDPAPAPAPEDESGSAAWLIIAVAAASAAALATGAWVWWRRHAAAR